MASGVSGSKLAAVNNATAILRKDPRELTQAALSYGVPADPARAIKLAADEGYTPDFIIPGFIW